MVTEEVTDPADLARALAQWERFDPNWAWFRARAEEVYERFRGQCVFIARLVIEIKTGVENRLRIEVFSR